MSVAYRTRFHGREALPRVAGIAAVAIAAAALAGCSFALPSLVPPPEETTGSIPKKIEARLSGDLAAEDWRRAKGALALALDPQGNGRPVKWDNPETGMKGEIIPDGSPFVEADDICRRFKATIEAPSGKSSALVGSACRASADEWPIKQVRAAP